jgi:hypothetical protein
MHAFDVTADEAGLISSHCASVGDALIVRGGIDGDAEMRHLGRGMLTTADRINRQIAANSVRYIIVIDATKPLTRGRKHYSIVDTATGCTHDEDFTYRKQATDWVRHLNRAQVSTPQPGRPLAAASITP